MPLQSTAKPWDSLAHPETAWLTPPVSVGRLWPADEVTASRDRLQFKWRGEGPGLEVPRDLLERFLQARTDSAVLAFAKRFGPLGFFGHGGGRFKPSVERLQRSFERGVHSEQFAAWRSFRTASSGMLEVAAMLREKRLLNLDALIRTSELLGEAEDSTTLHTLQVISRMPNEDRRGVVGGVLTFCLDRYVQACWLRPHLKWDYSGTRPDVVFSDLLAANVGGISLLGALTVQLLSSVAGSGFHICSSCGAAFVAQRRPAADRRRYCQACQKSGAPTRDAKVAYRARLREKLGATRRRRQPRSR
jgi:hypothetical protein